MAYATPDEVRQADADRWGAIGNGIKNWWEQLQNMPGKADREALAGRSGNKSSGTIAERVQSRSAQGADNTLAALRGKYNKQPNPTNGIPPLLARPEEPDEIALIKERLKQKYSFDPNRTPIDPSFIDRALEARMAQVNEARGKANDTWATGDRNLEQMHSAFSNQIKGQEGGIRAQNQESVGNVTETFDSTIAEGNQKQQQYNTEREEMLSRLGIAPAANAPDLVGQAIQEGNNSAANSRDARVSEIQGGLETNLNRNTGMANSVMNQGIQRRADLQGSLQEILGQLSEAEVGFKADAEEARGGLQRDAEERDYNRWLSDRQFDMGMWDKLDQETQAQNDFMLEMQREQNKAAGGGAGGIDRLINSTNPQVVNAFKDSLLEKNADPKNIASTFTRIRNNPKYASLDDNELLSYITKYNDL